MTPIEILLCILATMIGVHFGRKHRVGHKSPKGLTGQVDTQPY